MLRSIALLLFSILLVDRASAAIERPHVDAILIEKAERRLTLLENGQAVRTYPVALGFTPVGAKSEKGDGRTPEGKYVIDSRNAKSGYHLSLHISYPNDRDRARAAQAGVNPGGDVMIHGLRNGLGWIGAAHRLSDWTFGCVAVTDAEIEEIWDLVPNGTPVEIRP